MRLVDGVIDNEGRVEVCLHGVWGTVFGGSYWSTVVAYFVCNQLKLGTSKSKPDGCMLLYTEGNIYYFTHCEGTLILRINFFDNIVIIKSKCKCMLNSV